MACFDYLIALALITAGPVDKVPVITDKPALRVLIQQVAIHLQILDKREAKYLLCHPEERQSDLALLRRRYHDLLNAPLVTDCERFPPRDVVNELLSFNRIYKSSLSQRQTVDLAKFWLFKQAMRDTEELYLIWDKVRDARCEYYYVTIRRHALNDLREAIGCDAYYKWNCRHTYHSGGLKK